MLHGWSRSDIKCCNHAHIATKYLSLISLDTMKLGLSQIAVHCEMATRNVSGKFSIWLQIWIFYLVSAALPVFVQRYPFVFHKNLSQYKGPLTSHLLRDQLCVQCVYAHGSINLTLDSPNAVDAGLRGCATPSLV